jgi:glycosyltransferase involved in cell wall biosynthesis
LVDKGNRVEVVTGLWSDKSGVKEREVVSGVRISRVKPVVDVRFLRTLSVVWPGYKKSLEVITGESKVKSQKSKVNVIHSHIFPGMVVGALVKKKMGLPLLTTVQGGDLVDYPETTGALGGVLRPLVSWSLRQADLVHAVSGYLARRAEGLGARRTVVVPNGVDVGLFKPGNKRRLRKKLGLLGEDLIVISHSRLTPKNGLDVLIKAVALIKRKAKSEKRKSTIQNLKLLVIGEGHQRGELEGLIRKLGVESDVVLLGERGHEEIPEYLAMADVFCRPARDEGFGISFIEAMACGLPVVGTKVGGIPEVVDDERTGFLAEKEDVEGVAEVLLELLEDGGLRVKMGGEGRKVVEERFAWEKVMKQMEEVYGELGIQNSEFRSQNKT